MSLPPSKSTRSIRASASASSGRVCSEAIDEWSTYIRMDCCSEYSNNVAKKRIKALQDAAAAG